MAPRKKAEGAVINTADRDYKKMKVRNKEGVLLHTVNNGDAVAKAMLLHTSKGGTLEEIVNANKLQDKWANLKGGNAGTWRMSLGVMLRAMVKRGEPVKIGSIKVEKLTQKVEVPLEAATKRKKAA